MMGRQLATDPRQRPRSRRAEEGGSVESYARTTSGCRSFAVLGLALFLLGSFGASAATVTVTEQESGGTFGLSPEDLLVIRLAECASCGYTLTPVSTPDPKVLALLSHTVTEPGAPGGSATHTWQYGAVGTGRTTAEFRYAQPWNPESARTYLFTFEVGSALKILSFVAVPPDVPPGQPSSLQWGTTGGSVVVVSWQGEGPCCAVSVPANGSMTVTPKQTTTYTLEARGSGGSAVQAQVTVSVSAACPAPAAPVATGPSGALPPGSAFSLAWTDALGASEVPGAYEAQLALDDDFSRLAQARSTTERSATFTVPAEATGAVYARVRAVSGCGTAGSWGNTVAVAVARPGAVVILTQGQSPAWAVRQGEPLPSATLRLRNVGAAPATVGLSASGGFFTVSPASLPLAPGQEAAVGLAGVAGASAEAGTRQGSVTATWPEGSVTAAVTLTAAESLADTVAVLDRDVVYNLASGGGVTTQSLAVTNPGNVPIRLASSLLLGGGWLSFEPQDLADPPARGADADPAPQDRPRPAHRRRRAAPGLHPARALRRRRREGAPPARLRRRAPRRRQRRHPHPRRPGQPHLHRPHRRPRLRPAGGALHERRLDPQPLGRPGHRRPPRHAGRGRGLAPRRADSPAPGPRPPLRLRPGPLRADEPLGERRDPPPKPRRRRPARREDDRRGPARRRTAERALLQRDPRLRLRLGHRPRPGAAPDAGHRRHPERPDERHPVGDLGEPRERPPDPDLPGGDPGRHDGEPPPRPGLRRHPELPAGLPRPRPGRRRPGRGPPDRGGRRRGKGRRARHRHRQRLAELPRPHRLVGLGGFGGFGRPSSRPRSRPRSSSPPSSTPPGSTTPSSPPASPSRT